MNLKRFFRRCLRGFLCLLCVAALSVPAVPATVLAAASVKTTDYVNLRSGAGTGYAILTTLPTGTQLTVLDDSNAEWTRVKTAAGQEGYCSRQYLQSTGTQAPQQNPSGANANGNAVVTASVNVRKGVGTSYPVIVTLGVGASVTVLDGTSHPTWAKIRTASGLEGYCIKECLEMTAGPDSGGGAEGSAGASGGVGSTATATANLNVRSGAGTNYGVVTLIPSGSVVTVLDNTLAGWARVRTSGGQEGYCSKEFLTMGGSSSGSGGTPETPETPPAGETAVNISAMTKDYLSMRRGAGAQYEAFQVLAAGTRLTIIAYADATWAKVRLSDGTEGYCMRSYLQEVAPGAAGPDNSGGGSSGAASSIASVTADALRVRGGPGTGYSVVATVMKGTTLTVLEPENAGWVKIRTPGGQTGYVSAEYIQYGQTGGGTDTAASLTLSNTSGTVPVGKSFYIKANVSPSGSAVTWASSNPSVATVSNGYVLAVSPGSVTVTASSGSKSATCYVTVTTAEPVRTAYASPNIAGIGDTVTLTAVTDTTRDGVKFIIDNNDGTTQTAQASQSGTEAVSGVSTIVWKATVNLGAAGTYRVTAMSSQNGSYSPTGFTTSAYVVSSSDFNVTTGEERRVSDRMIQLIANWEGYRAAVYADQLTSTGVPTIGYGYTFKEGAVFYNNLSKTEAWAQLVNTINNASYTTELNKFIRSNNLRMNQCQFDALISFGYNVGAGYWNNSTSEIDLRRIMLNAVDPSGIVGEMSAVVSKATVARDTPANTGNQLSELAKGTRLTVTGTSFAVQRDGWYCVRLADGTVGWVNSAYVTLDNAANMIHDLNYTNAYALGTDMLRWNIAGGKSYAGLLYRRLGEANVYNYGDYSASRTNTYGYTYPAALAYLDA